MEIGFTITCSLCDSPAILDVIPGMVEIVCTGCGNHAELRPPCDDGEEEGGECIGNRPF